jgi:rRNA maturation protein Rpf1
MAQKNKEVYVARGKKTIDELAQLARKNGEAGITIIEEQKNKAAHIAVIQVDELGRWTWKGERLLNSTEKN